MTIVDTSKVTSKGQVTIPNRVRKLLRLKMGSSIAFGVTKMGIVLMPCQVSVQSPYSAKEWEKIEKLALDKGESFATIDVAKRYLSNL